MQSSTKGFELIISDCDGVLVDTEPIINRADVGEMVESGFRQSLAPMDGVTELLARAQIQSPDSAHLPENRRTGGV
jgi:phosphoglycolate phosphatase-like HAD superfamily hydrolase